MGKHPAIDDYEWSEESVRKALERGPEECWNCYAYFTNVEEGEDEFDYYTDMFTQDVVDAQTVKKYIDSIHDGYFAWWDALDDLEFTLQKVPLSVWDDMERSDVDGQWMDAPVYSHRLSDTLRRFQNQHPDDDYPPVVLRRRSPNETVKDDGYEVIDGFHRLNALQILGEEGVMAWVGTESKAEKKAEEKWYGPPALEAVMNEDVRDQYGYSMFSKALAEWSEKFQAGELPLVAGGWGFYHNRNQAEPTFKLDSRRMISDAFDLEPGPNGWSQMYGEWIYESISQNTISGNNILPPTATKNHMQEFWNQYWEGYFAQDEEVQRQVDEVNRHYVENALRYVETLLRDAGYAQGKLKLYRAITLINPEDFDPTNTGQSWTPDKSAATPYFSHMRFSSRKLGILHDSDVQESNTYILTALVPVESVDWYTTVLRALVFEDGDEKEIVLKTGAPIELVDVPLDLSFAIDETPEALIRSAEDEDWWFTMNTPLGPDEEFGPYDSH